MGEGSEQAFFPKEQIQLADRNEKFSGPLAIREIQIKIQCYNHCGRQCRGST